METSLSPRDIQMRVRAGESLEDLAAVAGLPFERVQRFAAPVLAEREHLALMALSASVRRRGETSGHRTLATTVAERLLKRGVDADSVVWDSHRLADGRWAVTARYALDGDEHQATFTFDQRGRYSVAADDEARQLIGEQLPGAPGGRRRPDTADEPTVDLSDELALVRATQEAAVPPAPEAAPSSPEEDGDGDDGVLPGALATEPVLTEVVVEQTERRLVRSLRAVRPGAAKDSAPSSEDDRQAEDPEPADVKPAAAEAPARSELGTLYAMLDANDEESPRRYAGLSDAAAVPETAGGAWEPATALDYPVEPSPADETLPAPAEHPEHGQVPLDDDDDDEKASAELSAPPGPPTLDPRPGTDEPAPPYGGADDTDLGDTDSGEEAEEFQLESGPPPEKKPKRKRAAVPSWDEIMFGGPRPGS